MDHTVPSAACISVLEQMLKEWTEDKAHRGYYARNAQGRNIAPGAESAVAWCVTGYISKLCGGDYSLRSDVVDVLSTLCHERTGEVLVHLNDTKGHAATVALLRDALTSATAARDARLAVQE